MTKIFIASSPEKINNNLKDFYNVLIEDKDIEVIHPTSIEDIEDEKLKNIKVLDYEISRSDRLKILESDIIILDWDSEIRSAYLYWSCVNPKTKVVVVSRIFPNIDSFASENIIATVKPEFVVNFIYSFLHSQEVASLDK